MPVQPPPHGGGKMTAEIAILNKSAVALAADSAVSIGQPPNLKIYNTVNKIFELSCYHPVGVMIYGRLDYMGLPFESIIKEYRNQLKRKSFDQIQGYRDDFLNYISTIVPYTTVDEEDNAYMVLLDLFSRAEAEIQQLVIQDVIARNSYQKSKVNGIAQGYINDQIAKLKPLKFVKGSTSNKLATKYDTIFDELTAKVMGSLVPTETTRKTLRAYAGMFLAKTEFSSYRTGLVFAGFGDKERCPSLEAIETDGIINGRLKYVGKESIDIGRRPPQADILGFAQDDMMKSFLDGADPSVKKYFDDLIGDIITETSREVLNAMLNNKTKVDQTLVSMAPVISKMQGDYIKKTDDYIKKYSSAPIKDMIRLMPRQEMSTLASSLIEITSLKRKVTRQQETVGGEVDVAIISKSEGFVWVKRKHYFPAELNQRFFARHYNSGTEDRDAPEGK
ncbi:hypothetical protein Q8W71_16115 [Methylobacterium sp. NEAU 140]|uniref:hypothetical protein n=1 Tax=Methylobacterium sp. NEAU 140 TaxID=3064945 RepID=UPI0027376EFA|nr:hypothetical protein [Methylobacterium sp. NEAU 140]MDP4024155.1 hypothetical protein [Methylobacterium sp. NEAU 140]